MNQIKDPGLMLVVLYHPTFLALVGALVSCWGEFLDLNAFNCGYMNYKLFRLPVGETDLITASYKLSRQ